MAFGNITRSYRVNQLIYPYYILKKDSLINRQVAFLSPSPVPSPFSCRRLLFNHNTKTAAKLINSVRVLHREEIPSTEEHHSDEEISRTALIWRAIKLPMYSVALIPLTVGSAAAYFQTGEFYANRYFLLLFSSFLAVAWVNLSNDVYDFETGVDKNKKESVVNLFGNQKGTHVTAYVLLALSAASLVTVAFDARNPYPVLLASWSVICGYIYQCPPFRLGYLGLGEPLCFAAFGPLATTAFYLLQTSTSLPVSGAVVSSSILVGLSSALILFCSHFHQIEDDKAVGKFSPLVKLGSEAGSKIVKAVVTALYTLVFVLGLSRALPFLCTVLCVCTLPMGKSLVRFVEENHQDKSKIFMAKYCCVRLHTVFGAALAAGLVGARTFAATHILTASLLLRFLLFFGYQFQVSSGIWGRNEDED